MKKQLDVTLKEVEDLKEARSRQMQMVRTTDHFCTRIPCSTRFAELSDCSSLGSGPIFQ